MKKIILVVVPLVIILSVFYLIPRIIRINKISCASQYGPCLNSLDDRLLEFEGKNYSDSSNSIKKTLRNEGFEKYSVRYQIPDKIDVYVIEKKAFVTLRLENSEEYLLLGEGGEVIGKTEETNLPVLIVKNGNHEIDTKSLEIKFSSGIVEDMFRLYGVKTGVLEKESLRFELDNGNVITLPTYGDREVLLGSLNLILSRLNSDLENSRIEVDLRYKNPVIRVL